MSVVIPTLNEERNLPHVLSQLPADVFEVIVVDGFSTDDTATVAQQVRPDARIIHQRRSGKGDALACGFAVARGEVIVMLDGDGSSDPGEIPRFVRALEGGADFAKGSRFLQGGGSEDLTAVRRIGNAALSRTVNLLFGTQYTDLCYGYNAFWRHCLNHVRVDCDGFEVETLINIRISQAPLKVEEVPSYERARVHGTSHLQPLRDGSRVLRTILTERFRHGGAARRSGPR